ncbi:MAG: hypothetical protein Kow0031_27110 [Anaerolineae bacterium]
MEILTILIVVLLVLLALALVVYPLWQQTRSEPLFQVNRAGQTLEEYQARYQATLASIKDLMFDREMGKVSEDDYQLLLNKAKLEAAGYRKEIDRLSGDQSIDGALSSEIEALVSQVRGSSLNGSRDLLQAVDAEIELLKQVRPPAAGPNGPACPNCAHPIQPGDSFCAGCGQPLAQAAQPDDAHFCPQCGAPTQPSDSFCARCGHALAVQTSST